MESIVFCKISSMKYYKGVGPNDQPFNGGSFVKENGYGHEEYNFLVRDIPAGWGDAFGVAEGKYCLGFVETKGTLSGKSNQLHVEKILGFGGSYRKEPCVSGVTVVWCATSDLNETTVVGWYKNATVFREYQAFANEDEIERYYNVLAKAEDCVLLPQGTRHRHIWSVPSRKYTKAFGFGQSMLWYGQEEKAVPYLERLIENINGYRDDNWLNRFPAG